MANAEDFILRLNQQVSGPAAVATSAIAQLEQQIAAGAASLREMEAQMKLLKSSASQDAGAISSLQTKITAQSDALNAAQRAYVAHGGSAQKAMDLVKGATKDATSEASKSLHALGEAAKGAGGPFGAMSERVSHLSNALSTMNPYVLAVVASLIVLVAGVGAFIAVVMKGIESAGQYRDELLRLQGASKGSAAVARELQGAITQVSAGSALAREKIADYAVQLEKTGLRGAELQRALEATAIAASAGGTEVASSFLKTVDAAHKAGQSVDDLSAKMRAELGGVAAKQALSLGVQFSKLKENITAIFSGADIEPLLRGIHSLLSLLDQNSAAGKTLKNVIADVTNYAIGAFLHAAIAAVKLYIAVKTNATAWYLLKTAVYAVVVLFGLLAAVALVALGAVLLTAVMLAAPFVVAVAAVMLLWDGLKALWRWVTSLTWADVGKAIVYALSLPLLPIIGLWHAFQALWSYLSSIDWSAVGSAIMGAIQGAIDWLTSIDLSGVGTAIIEGLASGISSAAGAVLSALTGVVSGGVAAAKSLLGIHSPSKVFHEIGVYTGKGMAGGVDASARDVATSTEDMAEGAADAARAVAPPSVKVSRGDNGPSFSFTNCVFGEGLSEEKLVAWLLGFLERAGLSPEPAT